MIANLPSAAVRAFVVQKPSALVLAALACPLLLLWRRCRRPAAQRAPRRRASSAGLRALVVLLAAGCCLPQAFASEMQAPGLTVELASQERGFVSATGYVNTNGNYLARETGPGDKMHNYFVYDLAGVDREITAARLELYNPGATADGNDGFSSTNPTEVYSVFGGYWPASGNRFTALVDGPLWGSQTVSAADNGAIVSVPLNADFIAAANAGGDSVFIGGSITGGHLFGYTTYESQPPSDTRLVLTLVPEPNSLLLVALVGLALGLWGWRRRR